MGKIKVTNCDIEGLHIKMCIRDRDGTEEKELEYAFSLKADTSKLLGSIDLFTLDEIYFSVWKTNRKKVTDTMNMFMIEDFLKETAQA